MKTGQEINQSGGIQDPFDWIDVYTYTDNTIILTRNQLRIPGLHVFGWHDSNASLKDLKPHYHKNCLEISFFLKGAITFSVHGKNYTMYGGDAFRTLPEDIHGTNSIPISPGEMIWMQLDISDPTDFLFLSPEAARELILSWQTIEQPRIHTDKRFSMALAGQLIRQIKSGESARHRHAFCSIVVSFLYQLLTFAEKTADIISPDIHRACMYIEEHLAEPISISRLAEISCLSESHFKYKFRRSLGVTPGNYINQKRIELIKQELTRHTSLTTLSMEWGFSSSAYFSTVFKKYTGMSPSAWLRQSEEASDEGQDHRMR